MFLIASHRAANSGVYNKRVVPFEARTVLYEVVGLVVFFERICLLLVLASK